MSAMHPICVQHVGYRILTALKHNCRACLSGNKVKTFREDTRITEKLIYFGVLVLATLVLFIQGLTALAEHRDVTDIVEKGKRIAGLPVKVERSGSRVGLFVTVQFLEERGQIERRVRVSRKTFSSCRPTQGAKPACDQITLLHLPGVVDGIDTIIDGEHSRVRSIDRVPFSALFQLLLAGTLTLVFAMLVKDTLAPKDRPVGETS
jgi:hypothetical protein